MGKHFVFFPALALIGAACGETYDTTYATYAEAERKGAVERGWIPSFVPREARNIRDVHDLDTNEQTLTFSISPEAVPNFVRSLDGSVNEGARTVSVRIDQGIVAIDRNSGNVSYESQRR